MKTSLKTLAFALSVSFTAFACSPDQEAPGNEAQQTLSAFQISQIQETTQRINIQPIGGIKEICPPVIQKGSHHLLVFTQMAPYLPQPGNQVEVIALLDFNSGGSSGKLLLEKGNQRLVFESEGKTAITEFSVAEFTGLILDNCSLIDRVDPNQVPPSSSIHSGDLTHTGQSNNQEPSILKQLFWQMNAAYAQSGKNHYAFMNIEFASDRLVSGSEIIYSHHSATPLVMRKYVAYMQNEQVRMLTHDFFTGKTIELEAAEPNPGNLTFFATKNEDVFPAVIDLSMDENGNVTSKLRGKGPFGQTFTLQMEYKRIRK